MIIKIIKVFEVKVSLLNPESGNLTVNIATDNIIKELND